MAEFIPLKIAVAYNMHEVLEGKKDENISEASVKEEAFEVYHALRRKGHIVYLLPLRKSLSGFLQRLKQIAPDVVVNLCEGYRGRAQWEAGVAALLEMEGHSFTGNKAPTLALCLDKFRTKALLQACGLPTPKYALMRSADESIPLDFPLIVKPNNEDASLGIYSSSVVRSEEQLRTQVRRILRQYRQPALVEAFIEQREFNVAVWENNSPQVLAVQEIDFSTMPAGQPNICGYEAKWYENHRLYAATKPICPARIDSSLQTRFVEISLAAFKAVGCRDYARVDYRMDDKENIYILEVNPNPDISRNAGFARALTYAGIEYDDFWNHLIQRARKNKEIG